VGTVAEAAIDKCLDTSDRGSTIALPSAVALRWETVAVAGVLPMATRIASAVRDFYKELPEMVMLLPLVIRIPPVELHPQ